ncbi:MAG: hypothetical protein C4519_05555 [Desulfobacteraceae bacterium]|nr:MAG: hypothetical protein C4519_05555 [Desulfobacteraceae bacterium]
MEARHINDTPYVPNAGNPRRGFIQTRLQNFGLTMIVMGASFILYYLGLFGGVEGPMTPAYIGERLAAAGFTNRHLLILLLSCMLIAIVWNWLYNGICFLSGRRLTCACRLKEDGRLCAVAVRRDRDCGHVCSAGHRRPKVRFHPVKKGTVAHFVWMMFMVFSGIVIYLS